MANEVNVPLYGCWHEQDRLTSYWAGSWYCTDTQVGYKVYFLDGEPVAITSQIGRKSDEEFEWISVDAYKKVRDYILTFLDNLEYNSNIAIADMDEEVGDGYKLDENSSLYPYHFKSATLNDEAVEIIEKDKDTNYSIAQTVKIKTQSGEIKFVMVKDLDFSYNLAATPTF